MCIFIYLLHDNQFNYRLPKLSNKLEKNEHIYFVYSQTSGRKLIDSRDKSKFLMMLFTNSFNIGSGGA